MSKERVWNKGKRNGGGGPPKTDKAPAAKEIDAVPKININVDHRTEQVKRMNRDNWVSRPAKPTGDKPGIPAKKEENKE